MVNEATDNTEQRVELLLILLSYFSFFFSKACGL